MRHVSNDDQLSLAAVGLWHKLHALYGAGAFSAVEVFAAHPDPNAWGPFDEQHDLDGPLGELLALGYAEHPGDDESKLILYDTLNYWTKRNVRAPGHKPGAFRFALHNLTEKSRT